MTSRAPSKATLRVERMRPKFSNVSKSGGGRPNGCCTGDGSERNPSPARRPTARTTGTQRLAPRFVFAISVGMCYLIFLPELLQDPPEIVPVRLHRRRWKVYLAVPRSGRDHHLVLQENPKVVAHRRVVQGQEFRELLGVPRLLADRAQHLPADGSPDAAPKEPPKQPSKAVHADPRSQTEAVSSTFPSTVAVASPGPFTAPRGILRFARTFPDC